jgi:hypothetical protein
LAPLAAADEFELELSAAAGSPPPGMIIIVCPSGAQDSRTWPVDRAGGGGVSVLVSRARQLMCHPSCMSRPSVTAVVVALWLPAKTVAVTVSPPPALMLRVQGAGIAGMP